MPKSIPYCRHLRGVLSRWVALQLGACFLLAVASTWPAAYYCRSHVPQGSESSATVPLFLTWTIWWNADRALHGFDGYWDAPIFHPTPRTLAFSEPLTTSVVVAPILWVSENRLLAHTSLLLLALTLNGFAAYRLLRGVGLGWPASAGGAAIVELLPMVHHELGVLQLVPLCGVIWTVHALYVFGRRPGWSPAVWLAAAFALTYVSCAYYGLFLSLLLLLGSPWVLARRLAQPRTWPMLLFAAALTAILLWPVVRVQRRVAREHGLERSRERVSRLSVEPAEYLATPWPPLLDSAFLQDQRAEADFPVGPGLWKIGLAVVGAVVGLACRRFRSWTLFCGTVLLAAAVFSLGPDRSWLGLDPYALLMDWYPGFAQVRSAFRFAMFFQLMVGLLAALALQAGASAVAQSRHRVSRGIAGLATVALGVLAAVEVVPARQEMFPLPAWETQRGWIEWLRNETPEDCVIACVPFPEGRLTPDYEQTAIWMYWGTFHHRRMVNGYSGFFPKSFKELKGAMRSFPDDRSLRMLERRGVDYCVVSRSAAMREPFARGPFAGLRLVRVFKDRGAQVDIYRLETAAPARRGSTD